MPQNNAMLEKLARATKYSSRNCKGHNEIHKLIAAVCNIKLPKYCEGKKKANTILNFKNISGASERQMNRQIRALGRWVENTNGNSECMDICNMLEVNLALVKGKLCLKIY